ncbi:helix-turn-helix domain-containing protein [Saccharopolyspora griseoalba]|uniref:Helix-turn-helix domain-containing protein n=1 Tax=Saccharopolyspora griseoalba TaxID=1431848 RepID=A0ABW2LR17_9PSEU
MEYPNVYTNGGDDMSEEQQRSFAAKLAHLRERIHPPDRGPYSAREIAAGIADDPGAMTAAFVSQLLRGQQPYPRMHHVEALAKFFGVPPAYFFDDEETESINAQIDDILAWRDTEARTIAQRVSELSPRDRATVTNLIESLQSYEDAPREQRRRRKASYDGDGDG